MKKLRNQNGLTLTEMLCTVIIVLLFSSLVAVGANAAVRSFRISMADSQAQELCSTLTTAISDELRYAGTVHLTGENTTYDMTQFSFFSQRYGDYAAFTVNSDGQILLSGNKLIPSKAYAYGARARLAIEYDPSEYCFTVTLSIYDREDSRELTNNSFEVKLLNQGG